MGEDGAAIGSGDRASFQYPLGWVLDPAHCPSHGSDGCGYRVDFDTWEVGDLILTSRISPSLRTHFTRLVQRVASRLHRKLPDRTEATAHCAWDHAAIYVGKGMLVEARPGTNVRPRPVAELFPACRVQVRRIRERGLSAVEKLSVLQEAIGWTIRAEYGSLAPVIADAALALVNVDRMVIMDRTKRSEYKIQCSELWATIIMNSIIPDPDDELAGGVTGLGIWKLISRGLESRGVLPPELSCDPGLQNVNLGWQA